MTDSTYIPSVYVKKGCPFSFKFLVFLLETDLLNRFNVVQLDTATPEFESVKRRLAADSGQSVTFPIAEIYPNEFMSDSDGLIAHFAQANRIDATSLAILKFYKEGLFQSFIGLFKKVNALS